jgi:hypothetical protein
MPGTLSLYGFRPSIFAASSRLNPASLTVARLRKCGTLIEANAQNRRMSARLHRRWPEIFGGAGAPLRIQRNTNQLPLPFGSVIRERNSAVVNVSIRVPFFFEEARRARMTANFLTRRTGGKSGYRRVVNEMSEALIHLSQIRVGARSCDERWAPRVRAWNRAHVRRLKLPQQLVNAFD